MDRRKIWQNIYTYIRRLITETSILLAIAVLIKQEQKHGCATLSYNNVTNSTKYSSWQAVKKLALFCTDYKI
jgi:hypothetical protein